MQSVLADVAVSVSELKKNPTGVMAGAGGMPVAVLNHNRVMGYMVPAELYEQMLDRLDDLDLIDVVNARSGEKGVPVKLGHTVREQAKKKLRERLEAPKVQADALRDLPGHYKIKLRTAGYRLVYRVEDDRVVVIVVAVGKRERSAAYKAAGKR